MAQHSLPTVPSRIFTRKPSLAARLLSASLLAVSLLVTLAGLGTAIYLERAGDRAAVAMPAPLPAPAHVATADPPAAPTPRAADGVTVAPPSPIPAEGASAATESPVLDSPPHIAPPVAESPAAGSSGPLSPAAPPQLAALESPPPALAPPSAVEAGHYWVEYGVFVGERYARRLQQALADHGLAAAIVATHAPDGRALLRVRSVALADYAEAREASARAERALGIGPLVHRSAAEPPRVPVASTLTSSTGGDQRYWVQFGAFPRAAQAEHVKEALRQGGIDTVVSAIHATSGRLLFLVRSAPLADEASALELAHRGRQAANVDFLVRRSPDPRHGAATRSSRFAVSDQSKESPQRQ
jgi:cell division septation protein DedD